MRRGALFTLALLGCRDTGPLPAAEYGEQLFSDPTFSSSQFNAFSCATCHATTPLLDVYQPRIAVTLHNSAFRAAWWGGNETRIIDAVDFCARYFMRGEEVDWRDPKGRALYEYLIELSPQRPSAAVPMDVVETVGAVARGDPARGRSVYSEVCGPCHGDPHSGRGRLSELVAIVPEASIGFAKQFSVDPALVVVEKIRHGQFFAVGGNMPLFTRQALSDEDVGALLAYLGL